MIQRRLLASVVAALLTAAPLAGCGTSKLDTTKVEAEIEKGLREQKNLLVDAKCPKQVEMKAQATFECPTTAGNKKGTVIVVQEDAQGAVRWRERTPVAAERR